jgi:hypothetical protein
MLRHPSVQPIENLQRSDGTFANQIPQHPGEFALVCHAGTERMQYDECKILAFNAFGLDAAASAFVDKHTFHHCNRRTVDRLRIKGHHSFPSVWGTMISQATVCPDVPATKISCAFAQNMGVNLLAYKGWSAIPAIGR